MKLFIFSIPILFLSFCSSKPQGYFLTSSWSSNHDYELIIHYNESSFAAFGPSQIIIYYRTNNSKRLRKLLNTKIANDGKNLNPDYNCEITWKEKNKAFIYLRGEEQKEKIIQIDFESETPYIVIK